MTKTLKLSGESDDLLGLLFGFMSSLDTPLVIISDLVQNSIEAQASYIKIEIVRNKDDKKNDKIDKGKEKTKIKKIIISDNGFGFLQSFENYSKHIGDSLKKKADIYIEQKKRGELIGEFCIGMHGFRSVATNLEVINLTRPTEKIVRDKDGNIINDPDFHLMHKCRRMRFFKDKLDIIIDEGGDIGEDNIRTSPGVTYILSGLTASAESVYTVPKIVQHLSDVKRASLLKSIKLKIEVTDGVATKNVEPFKYVGDKVIHKVVLPNQDKDKRMRGFGEVQAELYYHPPRKGSKIIVTVRGEPIYLDICQKIEEFNRYPWNNGMVEGTIEYDRLSKQPGRVEVQRDAFYDTFIDLLKILEKEIIIKVKEVEKSLRDQQNGKLMEKLEDVFGKIKREIDLNVLGSSDIKLKGSLARVEPFPDKESIDAFGQKILYIKAYDSDDNELTEEDGIEFSWNINGNLGTIKPHGNMAIFDAGSILGTMEVIASAKDKKTYTVLPCKIGVTIVRPVMCGSLYRVKIVPGVTAVSVNRQKMLRAIAEDMKGNVINKKVTYSWKIVHDTSKGSKINNESGEAIIFTAGKIIGQVKLHLIVQQTSQQGSITKEDFAIIDIKEVKRVARSKRNLLGLPVSQPITHLEYPIWHSRLDMQEKVLYYNVAHRDYVEVQSDEAKRQRYIANLYAKELALLECRNLGIENYGERLVEVMSKLDKYWKL